MPRVSAHAASQATLAAAHVVSNPASEVSMAIHELQRDQRRLRGQLSEKKREHLVVLEDFEELRKMVHALHDHVKVNGERQHEGQAVLTKRVDAGLAGLCERFSGMIESFRSEVASRSVETGATLDVLGREMEEVKLHSSGVALKLREQMELAARRQSDLARARETHLKEAYDELTDRLSKQETAWEGRWGALFQLTKAAGAAVEDLGAQCAELRGSQTAAKANCQASVSALQAEIRSGQEDSDAFKAEVRAFEQEQSSALELIEQHQSQRHGQLRKEICMLSHMVDTSLDLASDSVTSNDIGRRASRASLRPHLPQPGPGSRGFSASMVAAG